MLIGANVVARAVRVWKHVPSTKG